MEEKSSETNKHGLPRYISADVMRKVRQNSKFGCVVPNCRNAFYEYEHIIPEWNDAKEHDPDKICLVCNNHNPRREGKTGRANYNKEQIQKYYERIRASDKAHRPKNHDFFNGFESEPNIYLGNSRFYNTPSIINVNGEDIFSFKKNTDEDEFAPQFLFSGMFKDSMGNLLFQIENNTWSSPTDHWDIVTKNGEIAIWDRSKKLVFKAIKVPSNNSIVVTHLNMWFHPYHILVKKNYFGIGCFSQDLKRYIYIYFDCDINYGEHGIFLNSDELLEAPPVTVKPTDIVPANLLIEGGKGLIVPGYGIWVGKESGQMYYRYIGTSSK
ncbi:hypothetical protein [Telluribacter sp. SYSU D00476]|uniref:hypothetical protein n=1 Tax=Telluribacter sp. SYSU D00476 TaxID=2811430 RepID=UPI001FF5F039|nr:hypothetical protein [Telluribacter sp. SYSU D00476]